jgi:ABC-type transporter Mla subunit MlaD
VRGASDLELVPGRSRRHLAAHATLPLRRAAGPVELTDLFSLFDGSARRNIRGLLGELGPGLAGRGPALSDTVAGLGRIVGPLTAVSRTLAAPRTRLADSITSYAVFTEAITPVAGDLAGVVDDAATTFGALASERRPLHAALGELPRTETAVTRALVRLRPALNDLSAVATDLRPASRVLPSTLASTNRALHDGVPAARGLPAFATRLGSTLRAVATFARRTVTGQAVRRLSDLVVALRPTVEILESAQRSCNLIPPMLQDVSQLASFPLVGRDPKNPPLYAALLQISHLGAQGEVFQQAAPSPNVAINYLPHENEHECESGNELHDGVSQVLSNPPGNQPTTHPSSEPPVDATRRAQAAGLLDRPDGWRP